VNTLHTYDTEVTWTGDLGEGTTNYLSYGRDHEVTADGPPPIPASADPAFRGDPERWNPEQMLLASLSQCHLLWYLHLCSAADVVVTGYRDRAHATMVTTGTGGHFTEAVLRPHAEVSERGMTEKALALHAEAHQACFIANSVNFPVRHEPTVSVRGDTHPK
jgi:organic hydroperoxide reductase OsmC/OhrA